MGIRTVALCERDGVVLVSSDPGLIKEILQTWTGDEGAETLADNREFTAIMSRSVGTKDERPQVTWFVDPIEFAKNAARGTTRVARWPWRCCPRWDSTA